MADPESDQLWDSKSPKFTQLGAVDDLALRQEAGCLGEGCGTLQEGPRGSCTSGHTCSTISLQHWQKAVRPCGKALEDLAQQALGQRR
eukprot:1158559-Pelagomonas_calceolata.AAC.8